MRYKEELNGGRTVMKLLEDRIRQDGTVLPGNVLKVDNFLNHQVDPQLMAVSYTHLTLPTICSV